MVPFVSEGPGRVFLFRTYPQIRQSSCRLSGCCTLRSASCVYIVKDTESAEKNIMASHAQSKDPILDVEPNHSGGENSSVNEEPRDSSDSSHKQDGVRQVEAMTTVWSENTMIIMYILYALTRFPGHPLVAT